MVTEFFAPLADWGLLDTWIVVTAALAAMACALPGSYLVLRRQSMMGDALSHTALLGLVAAFLLSHHLLTSGWISQETYTATSHAALFGGAVLVGVLSALLTEWIQKLGRVEGSAALGVVFTSLFALGLLLIRAAADSVHIDPDCVLYGTVETVVMDAIGRTGIPRAAVVNGAMLATNLLLLVVFYKELRIAAFDPALATTLGIRANLMHYALMGVTAATVVAAFESVGSILVIAMLIVPPAAAHLLTDRLSTMIVLGLVIAALSGLLGHVLAMTAPPFVFGRLGFPTVRDASTAGMIAATSGLLFVLAMFFGPRHGILSKLVHRSRLTLRIAGEDLLGLLYRQDELRWEDDAKEDHGRLPTAGVSPWVRAVAIWRLRRDGLITRAADGHHLTESGRLAAEALVRSHRLWESYMAKHFELPDDHLHETASRVEHYIDAELQQELAAELERPHQDPHGRAIPTRNDRGKKASPAE